VLSLMEDTGGTNTIVNLKDSSLAGEGGAKINLKRCVRGLILGQSTKGPLHNQVIFGPREKLGHSGKSDELISSK